MAAVTVTMISPEREAIGHGAWLHRDCIVSQADYRSGAGRAARRGRCAGWIAATSDVDGVGDAAADAAVDAKWDRDIYVAN